MALFIFMESRGPTERLRTAEHDWGSMGPKGTAAGAGEYTAEELMVLASLRRRSGRTCARCRWYQRRGRHNGCFPEGTYRKFLSAREFESGCDMFAGRD